MLKTSESTVDAKANIHSTDWLMSAFVNELSPPHVCSQQGQSVQQRQRIKKGTFVGRSQKSLESPELLSPEGLLLLKDGDDARTKNN